MSELDQSMAPPKPTGAAIAYGYALALLLTGAATFVAVMVDHTVAIPNLSLVFVLPVVIVAVGCGWGPAVLAAVAGVLSYNFFLIEPRYTLRVEDPANVWALALLLIVAAIVSVVAARSRQRMLQALEDAEKAVALQSLAHALAEARDRQAIAMATAEALGRLFKAPAVVLTARGDELVLDGSTPGANLSPRDREAAGLALASQLATRAQSYPVDAADYDFWPVAKAPAVVGVSFAGRKDGRPAEPERLVEVVSGYMAMALARRDYADFPPEAALKGAK